VEEPAFDEVAHGSAGLECRVQGEPWFGPHQPVVNLSLYFCQHLRITDVEKPLYEGFVILQHFTEYSECIH
jgi:hypothetical protein